MPRTLTQLTAFLITTLCASALSAAEYSFAPAERLTGRAYDPLAKTQHITLARECPKKRPCYAYIASGKRRLKTFSSKSSVKQLARVRFAQFAAILVKERNGLFSSRYLLVDNRGQETPFQGALPDSPLALGINARREIIAVSESVTQLYTRTGQRLRSLEHPAPFSNAIIANNREGQSIIMAMGTDEAIHFGDFQQWQTAYSAGAGLGDREGVLSAYPASRDVVYAAAYVNKNIYNKGIMFFALDFAQGRVEQGWLFNSEDRNVGFDPQVGMEGREIWVRAHDSTHERELLFRLDSQQAWRIASRAPSHILGHEAAESLTLVAGTGLAALQWQADSKIERGQTQFSDVDFDIAGSLFRSAWIQGRYEEMSFTLSLLENQAEEALSNGDSLQRAASREITSSVDVQNLLPNSATLRLLLEQSEINGTASYSRDGATQETTAFSNDYTRLAAMMIKERGRYHKLEYTEYALPTSVAFVNSSNSIVHVDFDPDVSLRTLSYGLGYDHLAYSARYENHLSRYYFGGEGNIGIGYFDLSEPVRQAALSQTGATRIDSPLFIALKLQAELGYVHQIRAKALKGLGITTNLGLQVRWTTLGRGGDESDGASDPDSLATEFSRDDLLYGPFLRISAIF